MRESPEVSATLKPVEPTSIIEKSTSTIHFLRVIQSQVYLYCTVVTSVVFLCILISLHILTICGCGRAASPFRSSSQASNPDAPSVLTSQTFSIIVVLLRDSPYSVQCYWVEWQLKLKKRGLHAEFKHLKSTSMFD